MKKAIASILFLIGFAAPVMGESRIIPPGGISQGTADSLYVNESGDTMTGPLLMPDGTKTAPVYSFSTNPKTGFFLSKSGPDRVGLSINDVFVFSVDATKVDHDLDLDIGRNAVIGGNTTLGDAFTDDLTIWPDQILFPGANDVNFNFTTDVLFDGAASLIRFVMEVQVASDLDAEADIFIGGRLHTAKGADVASADETTLGTDGNYFDITGTTTINHVTKTGWLLGAVVILQFDASVTVTHNAGAPAGTESSILLQGAVDFNASAGDTLSLAFEGTAFRETSRTLASQQTRSPIVVMFGGGTDPHADTVNATYTTIGVFAFGGTTALGTPSAISAVGFKDAGPTSWDWLVIDTTNVTTIAEVTGNTGTVPEISTDSSPTNMPAAPAIFEIQLRRAGGIIVDEVHMHSLNIEF